MYLKFQDKIGRCGEEFCHSVSNIIYVQIGMVGTDSLCQVLCSLSGFLAGIEGSHVRGVEDFVAELLWRGRDIGRSLWLTTYPSNVGYDLLITSFARPHDLATH